MKILNTLIMLLNSEIDRQATKKFFIGGLVVGALIGLGLFAKLMSSEMSETTTSTTAPDHPPASVPAPAPDPESVSTAADTGENSGIVDTNRAEIEPTPTSMPTAQAKKSDQETPTDSDASSPSKEPDEQTPQSEESTAATAEPPKLDPSPTTNPTPAAKQSTTTSDEMTLVKVMDGAATFEIKSGDTVKLQVGDDYKGARLSAINGTDAVLEENGQSVTKSITIPHAEQPAQ